MQYAVGHSKYSKRNESAGRELSSMID